MARPEIGLSMLYLLGRRFRESLREMVKHDVRFIEVVDDGFHMLDKRRVCELAELGASYSLKYSVHAPFADVNIASPSKPILKAMVKRLQNSIEYASVLEAYMWVFHPGSETGLSMFYPGKAWVQNLNTSKQLYKFARDYGVKVAVENVPEPYPFVMKSAEQFERFYQDVAGDFGLVLDIGHANLNGQLELFLKNFSNRIVHIHAHDNRGKMDEHLGVGHGTVDWEKTVKLLKEISYNKVVVVESVERISESVQKLKGLFA